MRRNNFQIAAGYMLALVGLLFALAAGASAASKEKVIYSFTGGSDGAYPYSDLVADAAGNLYGTTNQGGTGTGCGSSGCGTVFELTRTKDGWKYQVLYSFTGGSDGGFPQTGLTWDSAGNLYGTTAGGGAYEWGTVFELSPNGQGGWTENTLHSFAHGEGSSPAADLVFDDEGNLYGANSGGGSGGTSCNENGCGTVFELTPQSGGSWTETTIHVFQPRSSDGLVPSSGVILDSNGNLYGMTEYGGTGSCLNGASGCGTIYEFSPAGGGTWTETILYNFNRGCAQGVYPSGGVFMDKAGEFLGTSQAGGDGLGTVFELRNSQKNGWQQSNPHLFYGSPDGSIPVGSLLVRAEDAFVGVTSSGGATQTGTVFELRHSKNGWQEKILHSFGGSGDGATPQAGLVSGSEGHLYGTTQYGGSGNCSQNTGSGCGTVYMVTP
jgi:uncharacterized repeat protein (TIGR03803 family)